MPAYKAPLRDYGFCLNELLADPRHAALRGFEEFTPGLFAQVLEEGAKFCEQELFPLNRAADEEGCHLVDGNVITAAGFRDAYRKFCDGGWPALTCAPEHGGQGLPHMVNVLFEEMMTGTCLSFGLFPGLTRGAYVAVSQFGTAEQQALYSPRLASGEWAGSMCLTEAHCGTDLGLLRTRAEPREDGTYAITGTKIFISAGDHDLTPNIIYLVLARLPDAPKGTRGISMFIVPKVIASANGALGARNRVYCGALEQKMGIHGCPTCVMNFDDAAGWLIGEPHQGLKAMFSMMNAERIAVGIQGLALAEASYQNAASYARERLQGRSANGALAPERPADPIIVHPDVRRMLLTQRALVEGGRMLALWTAQALDVAERGGETENRQHADDLVALLTPVVKAFLTDTGSEAANLGMQVLGGHGYIRANGQEQYVRDVRITQIYEGTNGIQSLDLLGRKVLQLDLFRCLGDPVDGFIASERHNGGMAEFISPLSTAFELLKDATAALRQRSAHHPEEAGAAATDYMRLFALTALAYLWARAARIALPKSNQAFYGSKLATARFFMQRLLPQTLGLHAAIMSGAASVMELDEAAF